MLNFRVARAAAVTGRTLEGLVREGLRENGITIPTAEICYGAGYSGISPALNARCSAANKLEQAQILRRGLGLEALGVFTDRQEAEEYLRMEGHQPLFARNLVHSKGRDIKIALEDWQIAGLMASGTAFFTPHVPSVREFRTWVYRKRHLGTYEKALRRPADCKRLGRNHDNGFDFSGIENENVPDRLKDVARRAVAVLNLDFGAVDILQRASGDYVVLEVNSAPGVSDERRRVIQGLAHRIVRWCANDCPAREA